MPNFTPIKHINNQPLTLIHLTTFRLIILIRQYLNSVTNIIEDGAAMVYIRFTMEYLQHIKANPCGAFHFILMNLTENKKTNPRHYLSLNSSDPQEVLTEIFPILFDQYYVVKNLLKGQDYFVQFLKDICPSFKMSSLIKVMQDKIISFPYRVMDPILDNLNADDVKDYTVLNNLMIYFSMSGHIGKVKYCIDKGAEDFKLAEKAALVGQHWSLVVLFEEKRKNTTFDFWDNRSRWVYKLNQFNSGDEENDHKDNLEFFLKLYLDCSGYELALHFRGWDITETMYQWSSLNLFNIISRLSFFEIQHTIESVSFLKDIDFAYPNFYIPNYPSLQ